MNSKCVRQHRQQNTCLFSSFRGNVDVRFGSLFLVHFMFLIFVDFQFLFLIYRFLFLWCSSSC